MKPLREDADWHFPMAHYLESWGDAMAGDGTLVAIQLLIQPLFGGLTELEFLGTIAYNAQNSDYELARLAFRDRASFFNGTGSDMPKVETALEKIPVQRLSRRFDAVHAGKTAG